MTTATILHLLGPLLLAVVQDEAPGQTELTYPIVDTGQVTCFGSGPAIAPPAAGARFYGQDAQYAGAVPTYRFEGDGSAGAGTDGVGTVHDLVTGLIWTREPLEGLTFESAPAAAERCRIGGFDDWRVPTIKELYSLIQFTGVDPDPNAEDAAGLTPFIDTAAFSGFRYGDPALGERIIDAQYLSSTRYVHTTMRGSETVFGVNFADGRIKGYPTASRRGATRFFALFVRGNPNYGINAFVAGDDDTETDTVTDTATGLTWMQTDSERGLDWADALAYAEGLELGGHDDWRLPTAKELQSIVDYTRSPDTTNSAAIDPVFAATAITNEGGARDFGQYWTSTSHRREQGADSAVYLCFGRALGFMAERGSRSVDLLDVHGAGAQRSDPKDGDASRFPEGRGPQGDVIRIENLVRCVRGGNVTAITVATDHPSTDESDPPTDGRPTERASGTDGPSGSRFMRRFDVDGDGRVTTDEFDGARRAFERFDLDGDGVVTRAEATGAGAQTDEQQGSEAVDPLVAPAIERTPAETTGAARNVVLVLVDDLGWTGLSVRSDERIPESASDYYQTPNLERLAAEGLRFSNAYSPAALCTPSRAAILTGRSPARLHITTPGGGASSEEGAVETPRSLRSLPAEEVCVAEILGAAGYRCAHLGKWHLGNEGPGAHGFHVHDGATSNAVPGTPSDANPKDMLGLTERAIDFMRSCADADQPFYLQVSHYAVHEPTEASQAALAHFEDVEQGSRHRDTTYAAMTYDLDQSTGQLLAALDELGLRDDTLVIFTSDNGAASRTRRPQNEPLSGGKGSLQEGGLRVPLIVRGPGIEAGGSCDVGVIGTDLCPTVCDWLGVDAPTAVDGASLVPLLTGAVERLDRAEDAFLFHFPHYGQGANQKPHSAVVLGDHKLIRDLETGGVQLFDLDADIGEQTDLSVEEPQRTAQLTALLDRLLSESGAQSVTARPTK